MITNGASINYIKNIVSRVRKLFAGPVENEQKATAKQCTTKTAKHVWNKQLNLKLNTTFKAGLLLFGALVISRLLPLPANSEPLLGLAVLVPYLTKSNLAFLIMPAVMFISDLVLGLGSWMFYTYTALALAPFISKLLDNKYFALGSSWLVWHVLANAGQYYTPFSIEALVFDVRLLVSGIGVVVLYDIVQKLLLFNFQYNK